MGGKFVSREIDKLIAEKVMGYEIQIDKVTRGPFAPKLESDPEEYFIGLTNDVLPHYSTDIKDVWEVVEKIALSNFQIKLVGYSEDQKWMAGIDGFCFDYGPTAPRAICNWALKAVE